jgi:uncharacterized MAPEG superfamily protein
MEAEFTWLVWSVALAFVQVVVATTGATLQVGLPRLAANRADMPELSGWVGRMQRAHRNMLESLPLFAILVLVAVVSGRNNAVTLMGAQIFFWARLVYVFVYGAGIPWLRTGVWSVSVIGMVIVFSQLL